MPRLTNTRYLEFHHRLRALWLEDHANYLEFSVAEQMAVHRFFVPDKELDDGALITHRRKVAVEDSSLPQRAGRAVADLDLVERRSGYRKQRAEELTRNPPLPRPKGRRLPTQRGERHLTVRVIVRPEIDVQKLAKALVEMAMQQAEEEAEAKRRAREPENDPPLDDDLAA